MPYSFSPLMLGVVKELRCLVQPGGPPPAYAILCSNYVLPTS